MKRLIIEEVSSCQDCLFTTFREGRKCAHPEVDLEAFYKWYHGKADFGDTFPGCPLPIVTSDPEHL